MKYGMLRPVSFHERRRAQRARNSMYSLVKVRLRFAPGHFLDDDGLTIASIDATHRIKQKNQKAARRNELETALGGLIVPGAG